MCECELLIINMDNSVSSSNSSSSSSSGCSVTSSTPDIKKYRNEGKMTGGRSRSLLQCLSKHLGRHFLQQISERHLHHHLLQHIHRRMVYSSQEDLRSSSTDSFSFSYERNSRSDCLTNLTSGGCSDDQMPSSNSSSNSGSRSQCNGSHLDLSGEENTSNGYSAAANSLDSPEIYDLEPYHTHQHIYLDPGDSYTITKNNGEQLSETDSGNSSSDDIQNSENVPANQQMAYSTPNNEQPNHQLNVRRQMDIKSHSSCQLANCRSKNSQPNCLSITSSVRSMLQQISSSVTIISTRSLSCSNTPLKRVWDAKGEKTSNSMSEDIAKRSNTNDKRTHCSANATAASTPAKSSKKCDKKSQSILRPPIDYVYMKGMSGLYSRVPRYTVCCPNSSQRWL